MKINVEFTSVEEMLEFAKVFEKNNIQVDVEPIVKEGIKVTECQIVPYVTEEPVEEPKVVPEVIEEKGVQEVIEKDTPSENITKEMVRSVFSSLIQSGRQADAKSLTAKYGARKLSELESKDYAAIYKDAQELLNA